MRGPKPKSAHRFTERPADCRSKDQIDEDGLIQRERNFVHQLMLHGFQGRAAREAGYSAKSANAISKRLLETPRIIRVLERDRKHVAEQYQIERATVLKRLASVAFNQPKDFFDENGTPLAPHEISDRTAEALGGFKITHPLQDPGCEVIEYKLKDSIAALAEIAKIQGYYKPDGETDRNFLAELVRSLDDPGSVSVTVKREAVTEDKKAPSKEEKKR